MTNLAEALALAVQHHQAGRLSAAEEIYRQILATDSNQPDAWHLLGVLAQQVGQSALAVEYLSQAIEFSPEQSRYHNSLGEAYRAQGNPSAAVRCYQQALALNPADAEVQYNLATAFTAQGNLDAAISLYQQVLQLRPDCAEIHHQLGVVWNTRRNFAAAIVCYQRALELKPDYLEAYNNLGNTFEEQGNLDAAIACYRRAIELKPDCAEAHYNLGHAYAKQGNTDAAITCYQQAIAFKPNLCEAYNNLGTVLNRQGRIEDAITCFRRLLEVNPQYFEAYSNLGNALKDQGKLNEAMACYRQALAIKPDHALVHSNLILAMLYAHGDDAPAIRAEHQRWNQQHAAPLATEIVAHPNSRDTQRRLRIGYVSPDFKNHPVGRSMLRLLEAHDHSQFEIYGYASVSVSDMLTERSRACFDVWRDVSHRTDEQVSRMIRQDQIDILIDLSLHSANNRLPIFASKPAPVQASFAGYPGSAGLQSIDYHLTDNYLEPPCEGEVHWASAPLRLHDSFWFYAVPESSTIVGELPAKTNGRVTFGCLNNFCKVNDEALQLWSKVLAAVPNSRLLLLSPEGSSRAHVFRQCEQNGVAPARIEMLAKQSQERYFELYQHIDIGLETFPYNGHTTSLDSLWMGVPVVSVVGTAVVARGGLSILSNLGLPELIAHDHDDYVRIAVALANDLPRLANLRATLRQRMLASPLMDAPRFVRNLEAAYRQMWQKYCRE